MKEALKLALDALNEWRVEWSPDFYEEKYDSDEAEDNTRRTLVKRAITAIEQALAQPEQKMTYQQAAQLINEMKSQPEQEPVAWRGYNWGHSPDDWVYRDFDDPILDGNGNNVGQPLYTTPPQRKPLTDERLELIGHADLAINNIYVFNGYGEEVPEGRTPIYAGYKAAHGIKGEA